MDPLYEEIVALFPTPSDETGLVPAAVVVDAALDARNLIRDRAPGMAPELFPVIDALLGATVGRALMNWTGEVLPTVATIGERLGVGAQLAGA